MAKTHTQKRDLGVSFTRGSQMILLLIDFLVMKFIVVCTNTHTKFMYNDLSRVIVIIHINGISFQ